MKVRAQGAEKREKNTPRRRADLLPVVTLHFGWHEGRGGVAIDPTRTLKAIVGLSLVFTAASIPVHGAMMFLGRLEILSVFVLFTAVYWRK